MLPAGAPEALKNVVERAERDLLADLSEGLVGQEDDMTAALRASLTVRNIRDWDEEIRGDLRVRISVLDSAGRGSTESLLGADICGVVDIDFDGIRTTKGFLAQAKRSGPGLGFRPAGTYEPDDYDGEHSHWLWTRELALAPSGTVTITRPDERLARQCKDMLKITSASFVWIYDDAQIGVVSAQEVLAAFSKPKGSHKRTMLGTKRLTDFMVHVTDGFIGDPELKAGDRDGLLDLARRTEAQLALRIRVGVVDDIG